MELLKVKPFGFIRFLVWGFVIVPLECAINVANLLKSGTGRSDFDGYRNWSYEVISLLNDDEFASLHSQ